MDGECHNTIYFNLTVSIFFYIWKQVIFTIKKNKDKQSKLLTRKFKINISDTSMICYVDVILFFYIVPFFLENSNPIEWCLNREIKH